MIVKSGMSPPRYDAGYKEIYPEPAAKASDRKKINYGLQSKGYDFKIASPNILAKLTLIEKQNIV